MKHKQYIIQQLNVAGITEAAMPDIVNTIQTLMAIVSVHDLELANAVALGLIDSLKVSPEKIEKLSNSAEDILNEQ